MHPEQTPYSSVLVDSSHVNPEVEAGLNQLTEQTAGDLLLAADAEPRKSGEFTVAWDGTPEELADREKILARVATEALRMTR